MTKEEFKKMYYGNSISKKLAEDSKTIHGIDLEAEVEKLVDDEYQRYLNGEYND